MSDRSQMPTFQARADALFEKVWANMNAGRWKPLPYSARSLVAEVCIEAIVIEEQEKSR
jgi:hypothetical protein